MFNVPFRTIEAELPSIESAGFGAIQVSPPELSNGGPWWGRYQPLDYRVIDGPLGNESELKSLVEAAHQRGLRVIADLVLNHMANLGANYNLSYPPPSARQRYNLAPLLSAADFHPAFCIQNYSDSNQVRQGRICGSGDSGLPDLKQESDHVVEVQRDYVTKLNSIGIDGYRIDAAKHMEMAALNRIFTPDLVANKLVFGEIIAFQSSFGRELEPYLRETRFSYEDFPLQERMRQAFAVNGSLASLSNPVAERASLANDRAVTFVINHDIPNNAGMTYMIMDPSDERLGYAYILGREGGVPRIMSDLGRSDGLTTDRWKNAHRSPELAAMLRFHNHVLGTGQRVAWTNACVIVIERGAKGVLGINKCANAFHADVQLAAARGNAQDTLTGRVVGLLASTTLDIPPRSAVMFAASP